MTPLATRTSVRMYASPSKPGSPLTMRMLTPRMASDASQSRSSTCVISRGVAFLSPKSSWKLSRTGSGPLASAASSAVCGDGAVKAFASRSIFSVASRVSVALRVLKGSAKEFARGFEFHIPVISFDT